MLDTEGILAGALRAPIDLIRGRDPARPRATGGRYFRHVVPGNTLRVELGKDAGSVALRTRAADRDAFVFGNNRAGVAP
jgi:hypothetical protein